jgi:DNA-binding transcriptional ArsR family regulator
MEKPVLAMTWRVFSNHILILATLSLNPSVRVRDMARRLGMSERQVAFIIAELRSQGLVSSERQGRRNHYTVHMEAPMPQPGFAGRSLGDILQPILCIIEATRRRLAEAATQGAPQE